MSTAPNRTPVTKHLVRRLLSPPPSGASEYRAVLDHVLDVIESEGGAASASLLLASLREITLYADALMHELVNLPEPRLRLYIATVGGEPTVRCPHCGGTDINRLEDALIWWRPVRVDLSGDKPLIILNGEYSVSDEGGSDSDPRWECLGCTSELADPLDTDLDWR